METTVAVDAITLAGLAGIGAFLVGHKIPLKILGFVSIFTSPWKLHVLTLSIETSGLTGMVALHVSTELIAERELEHARRRHAQTLIVETKTLLEDHGHRAADLELIAVSVGPGSFTGLRVGIVMAKTLAYATGAKLVAVDTLRAMAYAAPSEINRIHPVSDAQREQLFSATYDRDGDSWKQREPIRIVDNADWVKSVESLDSDEAITGPGLDKIIHEIPTGVTILDQEHWHPRASSVGRIGTEMAKAGLFVDELGLEPFYLRKSAAEEKRDANSPQSRS